MKVLLKSTENDFYSSEAFEIAPKALKAFKYVIYLSDKPVGYIVINEFNTVVSCYLKKELRNRGIMSRAYSMLIDQGIKLKPDKDGPLNNKMINYWNKRGYCFLKQSEEFQKILEETIDDCIFDIN